MANRFGKKIIHFFAGSREGSEGVIPDEARAKWSQDAGARLEGNNVRNLKAAQATSGPPPFDPADRDDLDARADAETNKMMYDGRSLQMTELKRSQGQDAIDKAGANLSHALTAASLQQACEAGNLIPTRDRNGLAVVGHIQELQGGEVKTYLNDPGIGEYPVKDFSSPAEACVDLVNNARLAAPLAKPVRHK